MCTYTVYWVLFTIVKFSLFSWSSFMSEHFTTANIYFTLESIRKISNLVKHKQGHIPKIVTILHCIYYPTYCHIM